MNKAMPQLPQGAQIKTKIKVSKRRDDDYLWKLFLSKYLYSFIALLHPELYELIDTGVPYQPLDTALRIPGVPRDKLRYVDFLAKVTLKDGTQSQVIVHIEIQGDGGKQDFDVRMLAYYIRLMLLHDIPIAAMALYTGKGAAPSGKFLQEHHSTRVAFDYVARTLDNFSEEELRQKGDAASLAILAAVLAKKSAHDEIQKFTYLKELIKLLKERNWPKEERAGFLIFLEGIIYLTDEKIIEEYTQYSESQLKDEEEESMYVSILEQHFTQIGEARGQRRGEVIGEAIGEAKKAASNARKMLLDGVPIENISKWTDLPKAFVLKLKDEKDKVN